MEGDAGSLFLSSLSSTAIHNLLVLVERNVSMLSMDTLEQLVRNAERNVFVSKDEWCQFLIGRLKRHFPATTSFTTEHAQFLQEEGNSSTLPAVERMETSSPLLLETEGSKSPEGSDGESKEAVMEVSAATVVTTAEPWPANPQSNLPLPARGMAG